jgi:hypothetical protein
MTTELIDHPTAPVDPVQAKFEKYHAANPHVYAMFVKYANEVKAAGLEGYSIWAVANRVRWHYEFEVDTKDEFKISNNYLSRYSRLIMQNEPELAGFFDTKPLKSEMAAAA